MKMHELIRKNDEHWRDNLPGLTLNAKLERAILERHSWENARERLQLRMKLLDKKRHSKALDLMPNVSDNVFCAVLNPKRRILDVGFNVAGDLILDNFGYWLAGWFRTPSQIQTNITIKNDANVAKPLCVWRNASGYRSFNNGLGISINCGSYVRMGSSTANPTRADYNVGAALGSSPENGWLPTNSGSYVNNLVSLAGAITAGGSGTVNETGLFLTCIDDNSQAVNWMIFHDLLGSGVSFVAGNALTASYSISI